MQARNRMNTLASLALLAALPLIPSVWGCTKRTDTEAHKPDRLTQTLLDDPRSAARSWLPKDRQGSQFALSGKPRHYDKEDLHELLNGGADAFLDDGLVSLLHVRMEDKKGVFTPLEVQVMDVATGPKAAALLKKERSPDAKAADLGKKGFSEPGSVLFVKGHHLVRVTALPSGGRKPAPVMEVARSIAATPGARW